MGSLGCIYLYQESVEFLRRDMGDDCPFSAFVRGFDSPTIYTEENMNMSKEEAGDRPRIGDFTRPADPKAKDQRPPVKKETPTPTAAATAPETSTEPEVDSKFVRPETDAERDAQDRVSLFQEMQDALLPVTDYKKYLKDQKIEESEAADIVDNLMMKGFHEERFELSKRLTVTLRTRTQQDVIRLQTAMQVQRPLFQDTMNELIIRYNMAASLSSFGDTGFQFPPDTASVTDADKLFDIRLTFVEKMPSAVFTKLSIKLAKFDQRIAAVMREGVAENF